MTLTSARRFSLDAFTSDLKLTALSKVKEPPVLRKHSGPSVGLVELCWNISATALWLFSFFYVPISLFSF